MTIERGELKSKERTQEWLEFALRAAEMGAWDWDLKDDVPNIIRNEQYDRIFGISSALRWTRDTWVQAIYLDDREATSRSMQSVISGESEEYNVEYRIVRPDGVVRWINAWGRNIRDSSGAPIRVAGVLRDVTDQKLLELERDLFFATLSHDLRNPLAAAKSSAELIQRSPGRIDLQSLFINKIISNLDRVDRMIQDLLDSSRMRAGHEINLVMENADLRSIMMRFEQDETDLYDGRVHFRYSECFAGLWSKEGIRRLLENLVGNAIKYGSPDSP